jgi:hypothetical protein
MPIDGEWVEIGEVIEDGITYAPGGDEPVLSSPGSRTATFSIPVSDISPRNFWILFRRRHPRIRALRSAYRRKSRR